MNDPILVSQTADLLMFYAVAALALVALVLALRQLRRFEREVTRAAITVRDVLDVLDLQRRHGHPTPRQPDPSDEGQHDNAADPRPGPGVGR